MLSLLSEPRSSMDIVGLLWEKGRVESNEDWKIKDTKRSLFACGRHTRRMLTLGRYSSAATQMGLPIPRVLLVSCNKAVMVC